MRFLRVITVLSALAAVSACASTEPMGQPSASAPPTASTPMVSAPPPSAAPEVADDVALPPSPVVVHFEHGKADITGSTMQVLWGLAPSLKAASPSVIRVQGFTDASGKASFNKTLSEKRAQAVADQLRKLGITARVEVMGQGVVKGGKKGAKDQGARRVEISWEPSAPGKTSATAPISSPHSVKTMADAPDLGAPAVAGAAPVANAAEAGSYAGFTPARQSPTVTDWAVSNEATGPPILLS